MDKTGLTDWESDVNRTPLPPKGMELHAAEATPGPVVQHFVNLGRYQLLSRLAVGGMAEVYMARQGELSGFKTLVVVKKVLPHLAMKPDFIAMFLDEARIASMLDHPNVVRITEVGRAENEYFLAMELVQGKPLASILKQSERAKTPIPHNLGALIVANAAAGLHHAHQLTDASGNPLGLVHRDVSPQNIMVSFEGSVKVIDFGIARALGRLGDTNSGLLKGKLGYMAPEQARGEPVDARADIFSLGVVLWECVAGRRLFLRENELATIRAVVYEPIPSASKFVEVDPALDAIIRRSVARNVNERFQTAEEMRIALEQWVFSSGGASTHDLSALMKSWFPGVHLQWQRAARLALDMQESDPPIEVSFPNLAASRTGHSRTGSSRLEESGSGQNGRTESSNRTSWPLPVPTPIQKAPDLRPKFFRRLAIPMALAIVLLAAGGALYYYQTNKNPAVKPTPEAKDVAPARPMVETLPTVERTHHPEGNKGTLPPPHMGETPRHQERESGSPAEETSPRKKRNRGTSGEKRAILREENWADDASGKRPNRFDDKRSVKKNKDPRPNPF
ncbi:MAG TPA: protein kinase [Polyangia bacterium]